MSHFPIELFRRIRFRDGLFCPRCGHRRVHRWGHFGWRRRYRCLGCHRTFSDFTGTPLAFLKRVHLWPDFCRLALRATTIRSAARALGIDPSTSFRWRHRLLGGLQRTESITLEGRVSVNATWFSLSEKGSRCLDRPARRYRFDGFPFQGVGTWFVVACDETGRATAIPVGPHHPLVPTLHWALAGRLGAASTLLSGGGRKGAVRQAARRLGLSFESEPPLRIRLMRPTVPESAGDWSLRLKRWLGRFNGVATKYLERYMVWFHLMDLVAGRWVRPPPLWRLLIGSFP